MILCSPCRQGLPWVPGAQRPACLLQTFLLGSSKPVNSFPFPFWEDLKQYSELQSVVDGWEQDLGAEREVSFCL